MEGVSCGVVPKGGLFKHGGALFCFGVCCCDQGTWMLSLYQAGWRGCSLPIRHRGGGGGWQEQMFDGGVG